MGIENGTHLFLLWDLGGMSKSNTFCEFTSQISGAKRQVPLFQQGDLGGMSKSNTFCEFTSQKVFRDISVKSRSDHRQPPRAYRPRCESCRNISQRYRDRR